MSMLKSIIGEKGSKNNENKSAKNIDFDDQKEQEILKRQGGGKLQEKDLKSQMKDQEKRIVNLEQVNQDSRNMQEQQEQHISQLIQRIEQLEQNGGKKNDIQQLESQIMSQFQIDRQQTKYNKNLLEENIKKDLQNYLQEEIFNLQQQFENDRKKQEQILQNKIDLNQQGSKEWINILQSQQTKQQENFYKLANQLTQIQNLIDQVQQNKVDKIPNIILVELQNLDKQIMQKEESLKNQLVNAIQQKQDQIQQLLDQFNIFKQFQEDIEIQLDQTKQFNIDTIKQVELACQQEINNLNQTLETKFDENHERLEQEINLNRLELIEKKKMIQNIKPQDQEFIQQYHQSNEQIYIQINQQKEELIEMIQNRNPQEQDILKQFHQCNEQMQQQISQQKEELIEMFQRVNPNQDISKQLHQIKEQFQQQIETLISQIREIKHNLNPLQQSSSQIENNPPHSPPPEIIQLPQNTIISTLYDQSIRTRFVEPQFRKFVNDIQNQQEIYKEYGIRSSVEKTKLTNYLSGMRRVRGDGNCFYTAFVFQYLEHQLINASDFEFQNLIKEIQTLPFKVQFKDIGFQQQDFDLLKCKFIEEIKKIRQLEEDRLNKFTQLMQDDECEFYGLAIVFIRNLAYKACDNEETQGIFNGLGYDMKQQLLEWEFDCQNNECVINRLSEYLKIHIFMFFITPEKQVVINEYKPLENAIQKIHMIFRPGHYCIGVPLS